MDALERIFGTRKPVIAMLHFPGLPGRPHHDVAAGPRRLARHRRARPRGVLQEAGVDGVLFCNEADTPTSSTVGPGDPGGDGRRDRRAPVATSASRSGSTSCGTRSPASPSPGRPGARFIREVLTGVYESDLGMIEPRIGEIAGYRTMIGADDVALFDNIQPEFASAIGGRTVAERAKGAAFLGVDAILISGPAAGRPVRDERPARGQGRRAGHARSSPTPASAPTAWPRSSPSPTARSSGTSLKVDGVTWNPVDRDRAMRLMDAARAARARRSAEPRWRTADQGLLRHRPPRLEQVLPQVPQRRRGLRGRRPHPRRRRRRQGDPDDRPRRRTDAAAAVHRDEPRRRRRARSSRRSRSSSTTTATTRTGPSRASSTPARPTAASTRCSSS